MSRCSLVYVPSIEPGRHVKNNACTVEIKIKWKKRKQMTHENTYRDDIHRHRPKSSTTFRGILINILYFHSRVKKFQNDIYFICNCVNSVNRDDMFKMATGLDGVILAVSIFMLFNRIIDYPAKLELRTLSSMIEDLGFYANNINSTLYDDFVLEKFTPQKQTSKVGSKRHHTNTK